MLCSSSEGAPGERQSRDAVLTDAPRYGGTRGGERAVLVCDGRLRQSTPHTLLRHLSTFTHPDAARSVAGTRCAPPPGRDRAHPHLAGKEGGRERPRQSSVPGALTQQHGSRCLQGAGEKKSFYNWLKKKPTHKSPGCSRGWPRRGGRRGAVGAAVPAPVRPRHRDAEGTASQRETRCKKRRGTKNIRQHLMYPLEKPTNSRQKRLKNEQWSQSLAAQKEKSRACSSALQGSGHYSPPPPPPGHVFCWDNTKCNLCFSIKSHFCSG